jgi:rhodanese-related sulfurtransferase
MRVITSKSELWLMNTARSFLVVMLLQLSLLTASCQVSDSSTVTNEQFKSLSKDTSVVILDVRTTEEYSKGHIAKSKNIDVLQAESFEEQIAALSKDKTYLLYCRSGKRSATALNIMKQKGFTSVKHLKNGITGWDGAVEK